MDIVDMLRTYPAMYESLINLLSIAEINPGYRVGTDLFTEGEIARNVIKAIARAVIQHESEGTSQCTTG